MPIRQTPLVLLVFAVACARTSPDTTPPSQVSTDLPATNTQPDDPAAVAVAATPEEATVKAPPEHLTNDDEIYGVIEVINDEAIKHAEYARKWAKSQRVKEFATLLITDHTAVRQRADETRDRLGLRKSDSRLASDIKDDSKQKYKVLEDVDKGEVFDKTFVDMQVDAHAMWINFIDTKLLPHAQMPDLRVELNDFRSTLERHYNQAKEIQDSLTAKS
jgi:putative membrane protein